MSSVQQQQQSLHSNLQQLQSQFTMTNSFMPQQQQQQQQPTITQQQSQQQSVNIAPVCYFLKPSTPSTLSNHAL
jgi:hypothetical protein